MSVNSSQAYLHNCSHSYTDEIAEGNYIQTCIDEIFSSYFEKYYDCVKGKGALHSALTSCKLKSTSRDLSYEEELEVHLKKTSESLSLWKVSYKELKNDYNFIIDSIVSCQIDCIKFFESINQFYYSRLRKQTDNNQRIHTKNLQCMKILHEAEKRHEELQLILSEKEANHALEITKYDDLVDDLNKQIKENNHLIQDTDTEKNILMKRNQSLCKYNSVLENQMNTMCKKLEIIDESKTDYNSNFIDDNNNNHVVTLEQTDEQAFYSSQKSLEDSFIDLLSKVERNKKVPSKRICCDKYILKSDINQPTKMKIELRDTGIRKAYSSFDITEEGNDDSTSCSSNELSSLSKSWNNLSQIVKNFSTTISKSSKNHKNVSSVFKNLPKHVNDKNMKIDRENTNKKEMIHCDELDSCTKFVNQNDRPFRHTPLRNTASLPDSILSHEIRSYIDSTSKNSNKLSSKSVKKHFYALF